ncbi:hypothetical protein AAEX37_01764 [Oligella sp. MSHR50489EDL]|uniref:type IV secretion system protein n=1 Tax=Oligella sp. MSHR50489EDL TaxID=3139409 RepID=UPI003D814D3D
MDKINELVDILDRIFKVTLGDNLFVKAGDIIAQVSPLFAIGFSIYVLLMVFHYYQRGVDVSAVELGKQLAGWLIVLALAFNAAEYTKLANLIYKAPDWLASVVTGNNPDNSAIKSGLIMLGNMGSKVVDWSYKGSGKFDFATPLIGVIVAGFIQVFGAISILVLWFYYLIIKTMLALTLLVGPLFVGSMLFPSTRQYGMNWIGQCLNYTLTVGLLAAVTTLQVAFLVGQIAMMSGDGNWGKVNATFLIFLALKFIIFALMSILVTLNIPNLAQALTGGAMAESGAGKAVSMATGAGVASRVGAKALAGAKFLGGGAKLSAQRAMGFFRK